MIAEASAFDAPAGAALRDRVDEVLAGVVADARRELAARDDEAVVLAEEIARLVDAGGKRLRPVFCYWGYRAAGGPDGDEIVRAAAALELLHTMALIHDDLMDGARIRRGVPASSPALTAEAGRRGYPGDRDRFGASAAMLAGDLAAVLADRCLLTSGFGPDALFAALARYHSMRTDMAAGQYLDVAGLAGSNEAARRAASLKGGSYTVEGPLLIGAALACGRAAGERGRTREDHVAADVGPAHEALSRFGRPLGEAFQLRDDIEDGEGAHGATPELVSTLVAQARTALVTDALVPEAAFALDCLAATVTVA